MVVVVASYYVYLFVYHLLIDCNYDDSQISFGHLLVSYSVESKRYGDLVLLKLRKFEKLEFRRGKGRLDITFFEVCLEKDHLLRQELDNKNFK